MRPYPWQKNCNLISKKWEGGGLKGRLQFFQKIIRFGSGILPLIWELTPEWSMASYVLIPCLQSEFIKDFDKFWFKVERSMENALNFPQFLLPSRELYKHLYKHLWKIISAVIKRNSVMISNMCIGRMLLVGSGCSLRRCFEKLMIRSSRQLLS